MFASLETFPFDKDIRRRIQKGEKKNRVIPGEKKREGERERRVYRHLKHTQVIVRCLSVKKREDSDMTGAASCESFLSSVLPNNERKTVYVRHSLFFPRKPPAITREDTIVLHKNVDTQQI